MAVLGLNVDLLMIPLLGRVAVQKRMRRGGEEGQMEARKEGKQGKFIGLEMVAVSGSGSSSSSDQAGHGRHA